ncbi:hypothetical protein C8R41DRAFT_917777 [Lentinula lateritia]|uniref:Uncharacterized protein n=3 Tax=Lentinula TaxID=5352 RepID=A0ABQ8VL41_9AGAR|nr:hypothetical protein C8R41DRAFT_917777 [Lentinula lateritia]
MTHSRKNSRSSPKKKKVSASTVKDTTAASQKGKGAPRYCKICPGRPLKASRECQHSALWRKANHSNRDVTGDKGPQEQTLEVIPASILGLPGPQPVLTSEAQSSTVDPGTILGLLPPGLLRTPAKAHTSAREMGNLADRNSLHSPNGNSLSSSSRLHAPSASRTHMLYRQSETRSDDTFLAPSRQNTDGEVDFPLDPVLRSANPSASQSNAGSDHTGSPAFRGSSAIPISSPASVPSHKTRVRITKDNPTFGWVQGAGRGQFPLELVRPRELPLPRPTTDEQGQRFRRLMSDIIAACERMAAESNCWVYIAGQHPNARIPFLHFASQRLRLEGPSVLDELHGSADRLFTSLLSSRRQEAAELTDKLLLAQNRIKQLESEKSSWVRANGNIE